MWRQWGGLGGRWRGGWRRAVADAFRATHMDIARRREHFVPLEQQRPSGLTRVQHDRAMGHRQYARGSPFCSRTSHTSLVALRSTSRTTMMAVMEGNRSVQSGVKGNTCPSAALFRALSTAAGGARSCLERNNSVGTFRAGARGVAPWEPRGGRCRRSGGAAHRRPGAAGRRTAGVDRGGRHGRPRLACRSPRRCGDLRNRRGCTLPMAAAVAYVHCRCLGGAARHVAMDGPRAHVCSAAGVAGGPRPDGR